MITVKSDSNCESYVALYITMPIAVEEKVVNKSVILNHFDMLLLPSLLTMQKDTYTQVLMSKRYAWALCAVDICKKAANINCFYHKRSKISYYS